jgi:hypothetical protein
VPGSATGARLRPAAYRLDGRNTPGERGWVKTKDRETWWRYELEREGFAAGHA